MRVWLNASFEDEKSLFSSLFTGEICSFAELLNREAGF